MNQQALDIDEFLRTGFDLKSHLADFLQIRISDLDNRLQRGVDDLAALHPGALLPGEVDAFYEEKVGAAHLFDLASWHLNSSKYIADTLHLLKMFATGKVLDFGGGIGTHAIAAAALPQVEHVYFVDINPINREFVNQRAENLGLNEHISVFRDLKSLRESKFDTIVCLDVLEHLPNPSLQLDLFLEKLSKEGIALLNWYFYKGDNGEFPFHFDDSKLVEDFFLKLQDNFLEVFHPLLITTRAYQSRNIANK